MLTQTSRPDFIKKANSSYEMYYADSYGLNDADKIHRFESYTPRKAERPRPMPEYNDLNYDMIKPKLKRGYVKFSSFKDRSSFGAFRETGSLSLIDYSVKYPSAHCGSKDFSRMLGRKSWLFPKADFNIKKKGDSKILRILREASNRYRSP